MRRVMLIVLLIIASLPIVSGVSAHGHEYPCNGVLIIDPYARPTVTQTGAAYALIVNLGETDLTLLGGEVAFADVVEIHEMMMDGDTMIMNPLTDGLVVPHASAVQLEPGGYHVMFIGVTEEVVEDTMLDLSLNFAELEEPIVLSIPVRQPDAGMDMGHEAMATEEAMMMETEEAMDHMHMDDAMMSGNIHALGACAEVDFSEAKWELKHDDDMGMTMLHLALGEEEYELPVIRVADMMMMDMNATPESGN